jgi:L-lactate permease
VKLGLQIVLGLFSLIPAAFAAMGLISGMAGADPAATVSAAVDNQFRYMSGVYILVSFLLWFAIPRVEQHFRLLALVCATLVIGGVGRLISMNTVGPGLPQQFIGTFIELGSPLLLIWQQAVARKFRA